MINIAHGNLGKLQKIICTWMFLKSLFQQSRFIFVLIISCLSPTYAAAVAAKSLQSCPTLCDPIDGSSPGSPVLGILQAITVEWVAISFSNACVHAKSLQSCPTLCDPMDSSPPGSSIHGILQARVLEWAAISFSYDCP